MDGPRRLLLLPTLNEERGLEVTLRELDLTRFPPERGQPEIVVIDGGSSDATTDVAAAWGIEVVVQQGHGKGAAIREGLTWAADRGFASVAVMDADGTYPSTFLPPMFHLLESGRHLVVGVRRPVRPPTTSVRDVIHRFGNGVLNYAAAQLTRRPLLDVCSGFWGVRSDAVGGLALSSDGFEIESELFIKAFRSGLRVAQIPIPYRERTGEAKLHAVRDGSRILLSIVRHSLRPLAGPTLGALGATGVVAAPERLDAVLLALAPSRVVFLSVVDRYAEAAAHAHRLRAAMPHAEVTTALLSPFGNDASDPTRFDSLTAPAPEGAVQVVVTLPPLPDPPEGTPGVLVGIPRTRRFLHLPATDAETAPEGPVPGASDAGFRPEFVPNGRWEGLAILSATLEASGQQREVRMLAANHQPALLEVYRQVTGANDRTVGPIGRLGHLPIARFLLASER